MLLCCTLTAWHARIPPPDAHQQPQERARGLARALYRQAPKSSSVLHTQPPFLPAYCARSQLLKPRLAAAGRGARGGAVGLPGCGLVSHHRPRCN